MHHTIGKVARLAGVTVDTLRYYEKEGLVRPASKTAAGYRLYSSEAVRRIRFVKHAQQCGFTLSEILALLRIKADGDTCCQDVRGLAIEKRLLIEQKIRALQAMSRALAGLIGSCDGGEKAIGDCAILQAFENTMKEVSP